MKITDLIFVVFILFLMSHEILECENMASLAILSEGMAGYSADVHKCVVWSWKGSL